MATRTNVHQKFGAGVFSQLGQSFFSTPVGQQVQFANFYQDVNAKLWNVKAGTARGQNVQAYWFSTVPGAPLPVEYVQYTGTLAQQTTFIVLSGANNTYVRMQGRFSGGIVTQQSVNQCNGGDIRIQGTIHGRGGNGGNGTTALGQAGFPGGTGAISQFSSLTYSYYWEYYTQSQGQVGGGGGGGGAGAAGSSGVAGGAGGGGGSFGAAGTTTGNQNRFPTAGGVTLGGVGGIALQPLRGQGGNGGNAGTGNGANGATGGIGVSGSSINRGQSAGGAGGTGTQVTNIQYF